MVPDATSTSLPEFTLRISTSPLPTRLKRNNWESAFDQSCTSSFAPSSYEPSATPSVIALCPDEAKRVEPSGMTVEASVITNRCASESFGAYSCTCVPSAVLPPVKSNTQLPSTDWMYTPPSFATRSHQRCADVLLRVHC